MSETIQEKLRRVAQELRITSKPLSEIIPLLQSAADVIDKVEADLQDLYDTGSVW